MVAYVKVDNSFDTIFNIGCGAYSAFALAWRVGKLAHAKNKMFLWFLILKISFEIEQDEHCGAIELQNIRNRNFKKMWKRNADVENKEQSVT